MRLLWALLMLVCSASVTGASAIAPNAPSPFFEDDTMEPYGPTWDQTSERTVYFPRSKLALKVHPDKPLLPQFEEYMAATDFKRTENYDVLLHRARSRSPKAGRLTAAMALYTSILPIVLLASVIVICLKPGIGRSRHQPYRLARGNIGCCYSRHFNWRARH